MSITTNTPAPPTQREAAVRNGLITPSKQTSTLEQVIAELRELERSGFYGFVEIHFQAGKPAMLEVTKQTRYR